ncbi:RNA polymerase sigma-70 factor [Phytoactinopolyspora endophytica]|uniref:RNA polymerase sigma-70 factor n=1 Tax=Phytoactinopolyspora endophytica TaxID=1642495 RepID=UPI00101C66BF|nr:RNA polymerase sigma-70 factor [Phytoactinopolyspora endophytica]
MTHDDSTAQLVDSLSPLLFSIAYRMLGSVSDAEDIVQEGFVRYLRAQTDGSVVESPKAYLSAVVTRLAIDHLRSARVRRETYVGQWLPEPLLTDDDPAHHAELADSVSMAFLLLLERLNPVERAVYLLHDIFDYSYDDIAKIVGKTPLNCRQLALRARRHVESEKPRFDVASSERDKLSQRFLAAITQGDVDGLINVLATDISVVGDGGGKAPQWMRPISGTVRVARLLAGIGQTIRQVGGRIEPHEINGQAGAFVVDADGALIHILALDVSDGAVQTVRSVINPDKLRHLGPLADMDALMRQTRPQ